jgi:hypothetical protein
MVSEVTRPDNVARKVKDATNKFFMERREKKKHEECEWTAKRTSFILEDDSNASLNSRLPAGGFEILGFPQTHIHHSHSVRFYLQELVLEEHVLDGESRSNDPFQRIIVCFLQSPSITSWEVHGFVESESSLLRNHTLQ